MIKISLWLSLCPRVWLNVVFSCFQSFCFGFIHFVSFHLTITMFPIHSIQLTITIWSHSRDFFKYASTLVHSLDFLQQNIQCLFSLAPGSTLLSRACNLYFSKTTLSTYLCFMHSLTVCMFFWIVGWNRFPY